MKKYFAISVEKKLSRTMRPGDSSCRQIMEIQGYHSTKVWAKSVKDVPQKFIVACR